MELDGCIITHPYPSWEGIKKSLTVETVRLVVARGALYISYLFLPIYTCQQL
jgi:hypothetical protein